MVTLVEGGPAEQAGIQPVRLRVEQLAPGIVRRSLDYESADLIVAVEHKRVRTVEELLTEIERHRPGNTVQITVVRDGKSAGYPRSAGQILIESSKLRSETEVETWYQVAALSVGGVLGVNARFWLGVAISRYTSSQFPWATFTINVTGSFAIGLCTAVLARWLPHPHARLLVIVGFLGGYTTFSSYSMESLALWERGERSLCLAYVSGSVVAGLVAVVLGTALGRGLAQPDATRRRLLIAAPRYRALSYFRRAREIQQDSSDLVDVPHPWATAQAEDRIRRVFVTDPGRPRPSPF